MAIVDPVHLPPHIEIGALAGPLFSTSVNTLTGGNEDTNSNWAEELLQVDAAYGLMHRKDPRDVQNSFAAILSFFRARKGRHRGFLFRDYSDYIAENEPLYEIAGRDGFFQLAKSYDDYKRRITRPVAASLVLTSQASGQARQPVTAFVLNPLGVISFPGVTPPNLLASFEFDVPMRFDVDLLQVNIQGLNAGNVPNVNLQQVRE